jgi:hypothetical protein
VGRACVWSPTSAPLHSCLDRWKIEWVARGLLWSLHGGAGSDEISPLHAPCVPPQGMLERLLHQLELAVTRRWGGGGCGVRMGEPSWWRWEASPGVCMAMPPHTWGRRDAVWWAARDTRATHWTTSRPSLKSSGGGRAHVLRRRARRASRCRLQGPSPRRMTSRRVKGSCASPRNTSSTSPVRAAPSVPSTDPCSQVC